MRGAVAPDDGAVPKHEKYTGCSFKWLIPLMTAGGLVLPISTT